MRNKAVDAVMAFGTRFDVDGHSKVTAGATGFLDGMLLATRHPEYAVMLIRMYYEGVPRPDIAQGIVDKAVADHPMEGFLL